MIRYIWRGIWTRHQNFAAEHLPTQSDPLMEHTSRGHSCTLWNKWEGISWLHSVLFCKSCSACTRWNSLCNQGIAEAVINNQSSFLYYIRTNYTLYCFFRYYTRNADTGQHLYGNDCGIMFLFSNFEIWHEHLRVKLFIPFVNSQQFIAAINIAYYEIEWIWWDSQAFGLRARNREHF